MLIILKTNRTRVKKKKRGLDTEEASKPFLKIWLFIRDLNESHTVY